MTLPTEVADRIVGLRAEGHSLQAIADALNEGGVPTAHARPGVQTRWHRATVDKVLKAHERGVYDRPCCDERRPGMGHNGD